MARFLKVSVVVIIGAALCGSVTYGGWTLWTNAKITRTDDTVSDLPVKPKMVRANPAPVPVVEPEIALPVAPPEPDAAPTLDPAKPAESRKELPKGKSHDPQAAMLATMASFMHSEAYQRFINQPGMGMSRMMPTLSAMPREWKNPEWTSEELAKEQPPIPGAKDVNLIHRLSLKGLDSYKSENDRWQALAKEARSKELKKEHLWEIKSLDLVGLVVHESPVVYVSEKLPDMKDLKNRPTRELDVFESEGLEELMSGKSIYIRQKEGTVRVLGPIHAAKACLKCHSDAKDDAMLGAFSYTLRPGRYVANHFRGGKKGIEINSATPIVADPFGEPPPARLQPTPKK